MRHQSGSPQSWKARREAYRKTQGPVGVPHHLSLTNRKARRRAAKFAEGVQEVMEYRQSIHCACAQCLPGEDRQCPARSYLDPEEL